MAENIGGGCEELLQKMVEKLTTISDSLHDIKDSNEKVMEIMNKINTDILGGNNG
ncbi:hypothetical protein [Arcobacter sp. F2176]|uniref:hypothetical protein n=1 Tax=Arcobacter sp. F2176 TaxID=2044511 RepID=UPI0013E95FE1|nr:hypothetical protein [Arcobacter sp. F2176]